MKKTMIAKVTMLMVLALVMTITVSGSTTITVNAASDEFYDYDVDTLDATVKIKANSLKVKKNNAAQKPKPTKVTVDGKTLKLNKDYTVSYQVYKSNANSRWEDVDSLTAPGRYKMLVNGKGEYYGVNNTIMYVYDPVESVPMSSVKVSVNKVSYTGKPITEGIVKSVKYKKAVLVEGEDYKVNYIENKNSGTGVLRLVAVEGSGFVGYKDVTFQITGGTKISKAKVTGITAQVYDCGNEVTQDMSKVKLTLGGRELVLGDDYVVSYYMNNKKAGTAKMVFKGKDLYNGTVTKSFKIAKARLNENMLGEESKDIVMKYTKKAVKPDVVLYDADGGRLVKGVDYTLSYKKNVKVSDKAVITVKGKGNYTGSFKVYFEITDKDVEEGSTKDDKKDDNPTEGSGDNKPGGDGNSTEGSGENKPGEGSGENKPGGDGNPTEGTGDNKPDGDKPGENKPVEDGNSGDGDDKPGEGGTTEPSEYAEPIGYRICNCYYFMPFFTTDVSDEDPVNTPFDAYDCWRIHAMEHCRNHEDTSYTECSAHDFEYLMGEYFTDEMKYKPGFIPEELRLKPDENGNSSDDKYDGNEPAGDVKPDDGDDKSAESGESGTPVDAGKTGRRVCGWCGFSLELPGEKYLWNEHALCHMRNGEYVSYVDEYSDGTKVDGYGVDEDEPDKTDPGTTEPDTDEPGTTEPTEPDGSTEPVESDELGESTEPTEQRQPVFYRVCSCYYYMPFFSAANSEERVQERALWSDHMDVCTDGAASCYNHCDIDTFEYLMGELKYEPGYFPEELRSKPENVNR